MFIEAKYNNDGLCSMMDEKFSRGDLTQDPIEIYKIRENFTNWPCLFQLGIRTIFDERRSEVDMLTTNELLLGSDSGQHTSIKVDGRRSTNPAECSSR